MKHGDVRPFNAVLSREIEKPVSARVTRRMLRMAKSGDRLFPGAQGTNAFNRKLRCCVGLAVGNR
jgi:hypothetical protein